MTVTLKVWDNFLLISPWVPTLWTDLYYKKMEKEKKWPYKYISTDCFMYTVEKDETGQDIALTYSGMLDTVTKGLTQRGVEYTIADSREPATAPLTALCQNLRPLQDGALEAICAAQIGIIECPPGFGKCLAPDTQVRMFDGTAQRIDSVVEGDLLMGPDSTSRRVLGTKEGHGPMYRITPVNGEPFEAADDHTLTLVSTDTGKEVDIMISEYLQKSKWFQERHKLYRVPLHYPHVSVSIEPYFIGLWLGDGLWSKALITTIDQVTVDYLEDLASLWDLKLSKYEHPGKCPSYNISGGLNSAKANPLVEAMRAYDLTTSKVKHIPRVYMVNNVHTRLQLLAGILDADGHLVKETVFELTLSNKGLFDQCVELAQGLGFRTHVRERLANGFGTESRVWRLHISGHTDEIPTKIHRKKAKPRKQIKNPLRTGFSISPIEDGNYFGVSLDGDKRHVLADGTVTHNTYLICQAARVFPDLKILVTTPRAAVVKDIMSRVQEGLSDLPERSVQLVSGAKKFTQKCLDANVVVVTSKSLHKIPLAWADLLLYDECHGSGTAEQTKVLEQFTGCRRIGLSASPDGRLDGTDMEVTGMFGSVIYKVTYQQALDHGLVCPIEVRMVPLNDFTIEVSKRASDVKRQQLLYWRNQRRNEAIAQAARTFTDEESTLILVRTTEHALFLRLLLPEFHIVHGGIDDAKWATFCELGLVADTPEFNTHIRNLDMDLMKEAFASGRVRKVIATPKWREGVSKTAPYSRDAIWKNFSNCWKLSRRQSAAKTLRGNVQRPEHCSYTQVGGNGKYPNSSGEG